MNSNSLPQTLMQRGVARWLTYWFAPEAPHNLAICRILFFGLIFLLYLPQDFALWGA